MKNQNDRKDTARLITGLSHIPGLGLSLITPVFLLVWGAMWLQEKFSVGDWVLAVAIVCGLISSGITFYRFVSDEIKRAEREGAEYLRRQKERTEHMEGSDHEDET